MPGTVQWPNRFATLPDDFYTRLSPTPLPDPYPIDVSADAAALLGLTRDVLLTDDMTAVFAGNRVPVGAAPLASVYSGHQFGQWAGQLGDGRAILLGEASAAATGSNAPGWELQLKGAGQTPYSRFADGRAVLRSSVREYLCSEAMHALGIPTTRALAIVGSDAPVIRETVETSAVVTRMAPSFIRFGHFEHYFYGRNEPALRTLFDFVLNNYYPACRDRDNPAQAMLAEVVRRTAEMIAHWQAVGFCHGVMNTDNMSILGLTIDYGPFGFMDAFDRGHVCNHSDHTGRYSYQNQPQIGHWNCYALGQAMVPLIGSVEATTEVLDEYQLHFGRAYNRQMNRKLGLADKHDGDAALVQSLLDLLHADRVDMTIFFRQLGAVAGVRDPAIVGDAAAAMVGPTSSGGPDVATVKALMDLVINRDALNEWLGRYGKRLAAERQQGSSAAAARDLADANNPAVVLRNHLAQTAIEQATTGNFEALRHLAGALGTPYAQPGEDAVARGYMAMPPDWAAGLSVSCSS